MHRRAGIGDDFLRVTAAGQQRHRPIAAFPSTHAVRDFNDLTGTFHPQDRRGAGRRRIVSFALQKIGAVDGRRVNTNANRALYKRWSVDISNV